MSTCSFHSLALDECGYPVCRGVHLELTRYERRILGTMIAAHARGEPSVSLESLHAAMVADSSKAYDASSNVVEVLVGRIRKKLRGVEADVQIYAVRKFGYLLAPLNQAAPA